MMLRWYFSTCKGRGLWCAMAKHEPFVVGDPVAEPGELWFEFGDTEDEAMAKLKASLEPPPATQGGS